MQMCQSGPNQNDNIFFGIGRYIIDSNQTPQINPSYGLDEHPYQHLPVSVKNRYSVIQGNIWLSGFGNFEWANNLNFSANSCIKKLLD